VAKAKKRVSFQSRVVPSQADDEDLASHVREVVLVRDYGGRLHDIKQRGTLMQERRVAEYIKDEKTIEKLDKKIEKVTDKLAQVLAPEQDLPVVRAFVVLDTQLDVANLHHDYRFAKSRLFRCCMPQEKRFEDQVFRVRRPPEPTNIIWENQDVPKCKRKARKAVVFLLFLIIIVLSLGLIYAANTAAKNQGTTSLNYLGQPACDPVTASSGDADSKPKYKCLVWNATTWSTEYVKRQGGDVMSCWCSMHGYTTALQNSTIRSVCEPWLITNAQSAAIIGCSSLIVIIVNVVVKAVLVAMAHFEKPLSLSGLNSSMMVKVFLAQTLNTGFVVTLVNYYAPKAIRVLSTPLPFGQLIFRGDYDDFVRSWYSVVGAALLVNLCINSFTPAFTNLASMAYQSLKRRFKKTKKKHQAQLLELYTNAHFDISARYAQLLTTVYCTMIYSPGLPLLNLFAALYCGIMYWSDKLVLLRGSHRPPAYDAQMPLQASASMLYSIVLHCIFALGMYGQSCTFPSKAVGGHLADMSAQVQTAGYQEVDEDPDKHGLFEKIYLWISGRIFLEATWMFAVMLIIFACMYVMWTILWLVGNSVGELFVPLILRCCSRSLPHRSDEDGPILTWEQVMPHIERTNPPASYRLDRSRGFKSFSQNLHPECQEKREETSSVADPEDPEVILPRDAMELLPGAVPIDDELDGEVGHSDPSNRHAGHEDAGGSK